MYVCVRVYVYYYNIIQKIASNNVLKIKNKVKFLITI